MINFQRTSPAWLRRQSSGSDEQASWLPTRSIRSPAPRSERVRVTHRHDDGDAMYRTIDFNRGAGLGARQPQAGRGQYRSALLGRWEPTRDRRGTRPMPLRGHPRRVESGARRRSARRGWRKMCGRNRGRYGRRGPDHASFPTLRLRGLPLRPLRPILPLVKHPMSEAPKALELVMERLRKRTPRPASRTPLTNVRRRRCRSICEARVASLNHAPGNSRHHLDPPSAQRRQTRVISIASKPSRRQDSGTEAADGDDPRALVPDTRIRDEG